MKFPTMTEIHHWFTEVITCIAQAGKPFLKQQLAFKQDNKHDRFAVAGQTILPGTLFHSTV